MGMYVKSKPSIALVTSSTMPKPDYELLDLSKELEIADFDVKILPWDGNTDWAKFNLVIVKSPWDYVTRLPEFLKWSDRVSQIAVLQNPSQVILWNSDKRYLLHLAHARIPIIPTFFVAPGSSDLTIERYLEGFAGAEIVIKPAVSIGAIGALRVSASHPSAIPHVKSLYTAGHVLIQPFVSSILTDGELSLVYFDGIFSHAVRKRVSVGDYRVQDHHGGSIHSHVPRAIELKVAEDALRMAPTTTLIARVDLVMIDGHPHVIELELIEPALFLSSDKAAIQRLISAIKRCVRL